MRRFLILLIATFAMLFGSEAMAIEKPKHAVVLKEGAYEVRRYEPYIVAEVVVSGDQGQAVQAGFRKLAGYIFGGNAGGSKIAKTSPVGQRPGGDTISMTSPVTQTPQGREKWTVQFMMPSAYTLSALPKPNDPSIHFRVAPAREMAVLRFSGVARQNNYSSKSDELRKWISAKGLKGWGEVTLAQYDPPWTPWFLRQNEVMIEVVR